VSALLENEQLFSATADEMRHHPSRGDEVLTPFRCECGAPECTERTVLTLGEYRNVRTRPRRIVKSGHERRADAVVGAIREVQLVDAAQVLDAQAHRVGRALERLVALDVEPAMFVIVESGPYYIQFALSDDALFCEAVHNQYLDVPDQLSPEQEDELRARGFSEPEHPDQNWFRVVDPQANDLRQLAREALDLLSSVYRLRTGSPITLKDSFGGPDAHGPVFAMDDDEEDATDLDLAALVLGAFDLMGFDDVESYGPIVQLVVNDDAHEILLECTALASVVTCTALYSSEPEDEMVGQLLTFGGRMNHVPYTYVVRPLRDGRPGLSLMAKFAVPEALRSVEAMASLLNAAVTGLHLGHRMLFDAERRAHGGAGP
jgi:hypothetical protein